MYALGLFLINIVVWGSDRLLQYTGWQSLWKDIFCRIAYIVGVGLLALPCMLGCSDFFIKFLTHDAFSYLVKVSYTGFLIHNIIIYVTIFSLDTSAPMNYHSIFSLLIYVYVLSIFFGAIMSIFIEIPFTNLGLLVMGQNKK